MKLSLRQFPLTLTPSLSHLPNPFFSPPPIPLPLKRLSLSLSISLTPSHFLPLIQVPSIPLPLILFLHSFPLPFIFSFSSKTLLSSPFISHFGALLSYFFSFLYTIVVWFRCVLGWESQRNPTFVVFYCFVLENTTTKVQFHCDSQHRTQWNTSSIMYWVENHNRIITLLWCFSKQNKNTMEVRFYCDYEPRTNKITLSLCYFLFCFENNTIKIRLCCIIYQIAQ